MDSIDRGENPRNPLFYAVVQIVGDIVIAVLRRPDVVEARRWLHASVPVAPEPDPNRLRSKRELAGDLSVSVATIDRLTREGLPIEAHVGDARRFDRAACRAWLAARGKRPTKAPKRVDGDVDVSDVIAGAKLRRVR